MFGPNGIPMRRCGKRCPVESVTWYEALAFCNALSRLHGYKECYTLSNCMNEIGKGMMCDVSLNEVSTPYECEGYRLPTEAEWEYAARAGTTTAFYSGEITHPRCKPSDGSPTWVFF